MTVSSRPSSIITLDRLRLAVVRNRSAIGRSTSQELVEAVDAQTVALRDVLQRRNARV